MASVSISSANGLYSFDTIAHLVDDLLSRSDRRRSHALFLIDHDALDGINDRFGRATGDAVIAHTERVLPSVFRATDLVARTYDDEFIVLMKDVSSLDAIECIAGLVLQLLRHPCAAGEDAFEATVTIGVAMAEGPIPSMFAELYDNACSALAEAKRSRRHRFVIFDSEGKRANGTYGFERLVNSATPNIRPFLDAIGNGGVLLRAESGRQLVPLFFSDSFLALLGGMSREEAQRIFGEGYFAGIHEDDRARVREELDEALASGSSLRTIARMRAAGGGYLWVSINMAPERDEDGRIDAFAAHTSVDKLAGRLDYAAASIEEPASEDAVVGYFSLAFKDGKPTVFRLYDDQARELLFLEAGGIVDALVDKGFVHRDSLGVAQKQFRDIEEGRQGPGALVLFRDSAEGGFNWVRFSYLVTYLSDGSPVRASGSIRSMPQAVSVEGRYRRESKLFEIVAPRLLFAMRADLVTGEVEQMLSSIPIDGASDYDALVERAVEQFCYVDDMQAAVKSLCRDNLVGRASQSVFQLTRELRREDKGRIRWTSAVAHLVKHPATHHLMAFVYVADIERRHLEVSFASSLVRPNDATGLYTPEAIERVVAAVQSADTTENPFAAVVAVRVATPLNVRALLSAESVSSGQIYLGQQLALALAQECLVARDGSDGFLLLFPRIDSEGWLRQRLDRAVSDIRRSYVDGRGKSHPIVLACGYSVERLRDMLFKDAVSRARSACRVNDAQPEGSIWSFDERLGILRDELMPGPGRSLRVLSSDEASRALTGAERAALDEAMRAMIVSDSFDEAVDNVLSILGGLYRAHRVFVVAYLEGGMISGLHEWCGAGAQPIIGQMVGRPIKEYTALLSSLNALSPVLMEREHERGRGADGHTLPRWNFIAYPIVKQELCVGFICVDNPSSYEHDVALIGEVVDLLIHLRDKSGLAHSQTLRTRDKLTGLPGKLAFERNVLSFDTTMFHSVAALRVGLEPIYTLEGERNDEAEDRFLMYTARNLCGLFPLDSVYRTDDLELTCICTNMSYDAFNARTTRMAAIMRQGARAGFALCDAWSDDMPSLSKLLEEAATSVYGDRSILFPKERLAVPDEPHPLRSSFDGDRFSIRLQPQVNLATGRVIGSEALARCTTPEGESVPPAEFVPRLEAEGNVSKLDYFVFEKVLSTMAQWKEDGLNPLPVSVNFSRQTVLDPSFVASVLALASRYDVPEQMIEIEITESMGLFKNVELRRAMETLRGQGFRFALDDLGSEYSTMSAMSELPFDTVKLDRLLVKRFADEPLSRSIVEGIARACEKNGIRCVAEGVEQPSYIEPLREMGCQYGQGYCFARPMAVEQFAEEYLAHAAGAGDSPRAGEGTIEAAGATAIAPAASAAPIGATASASPVAAGAPCTSR